jgi:hypothetical protein
VSLLEPILSTGSLRKEEKQIEIIVRMSGIGEMKYRILLDPCYELGEGDNS